MLGYLLVCVSGLGYVIRYTVCSYFLYSLGCLFFSSMVSFAVRKLSGLSWSHLFLLLGPSLLVPNSKNHRQDRRRGFTVVDVKFRRIPARVLHVEAFQEPSVFPECVVSWALPRTLTHPPPAFPLKMLSGHFGHAGIKLLQVKSYQIRLLP